MLAILSRGLDGVTLVDDESIQISMTIHHENVRGGNYYDRKETEPS